MRLFFFSLLIILGVGGYFMLGRGGGERPPVEDLPVIRADDAPVKELPEDPGGLEMAGQDNTLFSSIDGSDRPMESPSETDQATAGNEKPTQGFVIPTIPETQEEEFLTDLADKVEEEQSVSVSEPDPAPEEKAGTDSPTQEQLSVEPEITHSYDAEPVIEAESELAPPSLSVASIEATPPHKPEIPAQQIVMDKIAALPAPKPNIQPLRTIEVEPVAAAPQPETAPEPAASAATYGGNNEDALDQPLTQAQPRYERTAGGRMQPIIEDAPQADNVTVVQKMELPDNPQPPAVSTGVYYAQLASLPSREGARQTWERLQQRFESLLGNAPVRFFEATVPDRGSYTRVQVGGMSEREARDLCAALSAAGKNDGCLVLRGG